jgi:glycosyltransferase involved in cell wall biosynthesis
MRKVLIVSPFFFPELISTGKYNTDLAIQISKQNFQVDVLCSHPLYPDWKPQHSSQILKGVNIKRGGSWLRYPKNPMLRRIVLEFWFLLFTLVNIKKLRSCDAIVVVLPPSCFVLATFLVSSSVKIIGIVHDLQAVHLNVQGSNLKKLLLGLIKYVERAAFRKCDRLIYLSEEMKNEGTFEYELEDTRSEIAYPFITIDDFTCEGRLDKYFDSKNYNVVYSGALGEKQNPRGIYEIANQLVNLNSNVRFIFFSRGPDYEKLKNLNSNKRITFNDLVEPESLGELLTRSDIQIVPQASGTSKGSLPSKVPNILSSGSMIYAITDEHSELQELLSKQQGCIVSNTWDTKKNVDLLSSLVNQSPLKFDRSKNLDLYQRDFLAKVISNMIEKN